MPLTEAEKVRNARIARNEAMMKSLMTSAEDFARTVDAEAQREAAAKVDAREARKRRLEEEARLAGPRKSSRRCNASARQKIAAAMADSGVSAEPEQRSTSLESCKTHVSIPHLTGVMKNTCEHP